MGSLRFELRTSAMSRRRHNQLDHEPVCVVLYSVGYPGINKFAFGEPPLFVCLPQKRLGVIVTAD